MTVNSSKRSKTTLFLDRLKNGQCAPLSQAVNAPVDPRKVTRKIEAALGYTPFLNGITEERKFLALLQEELRKANFTVEVEYAEILDSLISGGMSATELEILGERIVKLDEFVRRVFHSLVESVRRFERETTSLFVARLQKEIFANVDLERLIMTLGLAWTRVRDQDKVLKSSEKWAPPESFARDTAKYSVKPENLVRLKTEIVKHLPYLVFGQTVAEQEKQLLTAENLLKDLPSSYGPQLVTSVYFDSLDGHFYHERLLHKEGARLLRLRWYGQNEGNTDKEIFVERKVNHKGTEMSRKDRFALKQGSVPAFLSGRYLPENNELAAEVNEMIQTFHLRPMVRTRYFRSAFQEQDSNAMRISVDTNMTFINELSEEKLKPESCCSSADDVLSAADIVESPILEVKLADTGSPPSWVADLLLKSEAVPVHKFSKFVHGMAFPEANPK